MHGRTAETDIHTTTQGYVSQMRPACQSILSSAYAHSDTLGGENVETLGSANLVQHMFYET